jgi:hypothetical protein
MAKLKPRKAGKAGHGNTKPHEDVELLHGLLRKALPKGSGAAARIPKRSAGVRQADHGLRLPGSLRRGPSE